MNKIMGWSLGTPPETIPVVNQISDGPSPVADAILQKNVSTFKNAR